MMDLIFVVYAASFLIGVWYAFRSGQLSVKKSLKAQIADHFEEIECIAESAQHDWVAIEKAFSPDWTHDFKDIADHVTAINKLLEG